MRFGFDDFCSYERLKPFGAIFDTFKLESDHGQRVGDLGQRCGGFKMLFEPAQREFHRTSPPTMPGTSKDRKP